MSDLKKNANKVTSMLPVLGTGVHSLPLSARPLVTVDVVIFTVQAQGLSVLLVRRPQGAGEPFAGRLALPGGFVDVAQDACLLDCAVRKLRDKTGLYTHHLEQLGSWGGAVRDPRGWSATHVYMALVPQVPVLDASAQWWPVAQAQTQPLAFDHLVLLEAALTRLRSKVEYTSLPAFLLPEPFTLPQLQQVYEVVLGRELDKSAFRKRMLDGDFLSEAGLLDSASPRKAMGYRIRDRSHTTVFPRTFRSGEALI